MFNMTTVIDALVNAKCNLETLGKLGLGRNPIYVIAMDQLKNGIKALENGMGPHDVMQEHMLGDVNTGDK